MYRIARNTALDNKKNNNENSSTEIQNAKNDVSFISMTIIESIDVKPLMNNLPDKYSSVLYMLFF
ncbi:MAG: DNA-directed RNA polymerase specialized sigma24 family protein [Saprospiraceae bacterium]|jgi:DNA-directed RNA polymerase specialized sigma24 family protein